MNDCLIRKRGVDVDSGQEEQKMEEQLTFTRKTGCICNADADHADDGDTKQQASALYCVFGKAAESMRHTQSSSKTGQAGLLSAQNSSAAVGVR
jgi:hypothetical protein